MRSKVSCSRALLCVSLVAVAVAFAIVAPAKTNATPTVGVTAIVLAKQSVDGKDYIVTEITIAPGGSTGWHTHQGQIYGIVKAGVLTHYGSNCRQDGAFGVNMPVTDPTGPDHVHIGRNLGDTPVVLDVTYINPAGATTSDSAANPGCDFG